MTDQAHESAQYIIKSANTNYNVDTDAWLRCRTFTYNLIGTYFET